MALTPKQQRFVEEYLVDLNATQAAIRAGYSEHTARSIGHENLTKPEVVEAVAAAKAERSKRTEITADLVLQGLAAIVVADARELVEFRRGACRHCWGEGFLYQRTAGERARAYADYVKASMDAPDDEPVAPFDELGGVGYHAKREPNAECPECFGDGIGEPFIHDTRRLSPAAARLYAGAKQTKEGTEVRMHSASDAMRLLGEHLGLFKRKVELTGAGGGPVQQVSMTPEEFREIAQDVASKV